MFGSRVVARLVGRLVGRLDRPSRWRVSPGVSIADGDAQSWLGWEGLLRDAHERHIETAFAGPGQYVSCEICSRGASPREATRHVDRYASNYGAPAVDARAAPGCRRSPRGRRPTGARAAPATLSEGPRDTARPLVVPTRERPVRRNSSIFGCGSPMQSSVRYSVVLQLDSASADHRSATVAASVVARHPAGGSTRRRSMVLMSGGPSRAEDTVGAPLQGATCHPT